MAEYLFVYGTLRQGAGHPMHRLLLSHAGLVGRARYRGRLFDLGSYPAALPDDSGQWKIAGELYRIHAPGPLLAQLDRYEGCAPESPKPHDYHRERQEVTLEDGSSVKAWIYLFTQPLPAEGASIIPSGDYLVRDHS